MSALLNFFLFLLYSFSKRIAFLRIATWSSCSSAEEILATCLASYNVKIKFIPLRFTRVRKDKSADEDFERTTRAKHTRYPKNLMVV